MTKKNIFYDVVLFHGPKCPDGMTSAWIYWMMLSDKIKNELKTKGGIYGPINNKDFKSPSKFFNTVKGALISNLPVNFVYCQPGESVNPDLIFDKNVLILDLDMGEELINIISASKFTMIIDHHFTSAETFKSLENTPNSFSKKYKIFFKSDTGSSGASLTWQHFIDPDIKNIPWLINLVRIGDTYTFDEDKDAKPILTYLYAKGIFLSFENLDKFVEGIGSKFIIEKMLTKGKIICKHEQHLALNSSRNFSFTNFKTSDGKNYFVAYCSGTLLSNDMSLYIRPLAEQRTNEKIDFVATWKYIPFKNLILVSIRDPLDCNLGEIASQIVDKDGKPSNGGGGHEKAAAFSFYGLENFHNFFSNY